MPRHGLGIDLLCLLAAALIIACLHNLWDSEKRHTQQRLDQEAVRLQLIRQELLPLLHDPSDQSPARLHLVISRYARLAPIPHDTVLVDLSGRLSPISEGTGRSDFTGNWAAILGQSEGLVATPGATFVITTLPAPENQQGQAGWKLFTIVPAEALLADVWPLKKALMGALGATSLLFLALVIASIALRRQRAEARQQVILTNKTGQGPDTLQASELCSASAMDASQIGICVLDRHGRILHTNPVWASLVARASPSTPTPKPGASYLEFLAAASPAASPALGTGIRAALKGQLAYFEQEITFGGEGPHATWVLLRAVPIIGSGAQRLIVTHTDITRQKQTQEQLHRLSQLIEQAPLSVIITDTAGLTEYVNPTFCSCSGYSPLEVIGKKPEIHSSGNQPASVHSELWATIAAGKRWAGELQNRRKDGALYWLHALVLPLCDARGHITHYAAIMEDITERKRTEQSLAWLAPLFNNTNDICSIKDLDLRVLSANRAFARAMGKASPEEIIGKTDAEIFGVTEDQEPARSYMEDERHAQRLRPGEQLIREETLPCANGQPLTILTNKFPVFDQSGHLIATANISTDITALKKTEQELILAKEKAEAASRAKSVFLAHMSHELRTPLNAINGIAAALAEQDLPSESKKAARIIQQGGQNLLGLIEEILEYTGIQTGDAHLDNQPFCLSELLLSTLRMASDPLRSRSIKLDYWVNAATPAMIVGDARRIQQILLNLLTNAVKFTERGRVHLHLETRSLADNRLRLQFSVLDTGIGIEPKRMTELFQPFVQASKSTNVPGAGAGLGLCIAQSIAHLMDSEITVRSKPGKGSAFRFEITVGVHPESVEPFVGFGPPVLAGKRALVIESDPVRRTLISDMLRAWNIVPAILPPHRFPTSMAAHLPPCDFALVDQDAIPLHTDTWTTNEGAPIPVLWLAHAMPHAEHHDEGSALVRPFAPSELASHLVNLVVQPSPSAKTSQAGRIPPLAQRIPLRILAADDVATNREAIRVILRHLGYDVQVVENGAEALAQLRQRIFDLVILDVQMPVMDGFAAAQEILRNQPDPGLRPRLVALTANAMPGDAAECIAAGMDAYISKPVLPQKLEACITQLFGESMPTPPPPEHPVASATEYPWIDQTQLDAILEAVDSNSALDLLRQLLGTFENDYRERYPRLQQACLNRDTTALIELVHGLKGSSLILGWARFSAHCFITLTALRRGTFDHWATLPGELQSLYEKSIAEMHPIFTAYANAQNTSPSSPTPAILP